MRPWSYSRLSTYEECPKQYWYSYVEQMEGFKETSPAASRGLFLHQKAEEYVLDKIRIYPPEFQKVSAHTMMLKAKKAQPEVKLAVTEKWEPCDYKAEDAFFRCIIDILYREDHVLHIQDWKSGQPYDTHNVQLDMYVATAAAHYPGLEYHTRLIYIDQGMVTKPKVTTSDRVKPIRLLMEGRIKNAESDEIFPTRSGQHCRWCDYSKRYGGPCVF